MNVTDVYGGYGGVNNTTKYVPPPVPDYVPQPTTITNTGKTRYKPSPVQNYVPHPSFVQPKSKYIPPVVPGYIPHPASIPFTIDDREKLQVLADVDSPVMNVNYIFLRTRTDSLTGVTARTFAVLTTAYPNHIVTYTMPPSTTALDLRITDGGFF